MDQAAMERVLKAGKQAKEEGGKVAGQTVEDVAE